MTDVKRIATRESNDEQFEQAMAELEARGAELAKEA